MFEGFPPRQLPTRPKHKKANVLIAGGSKNGLEDKTRTIAGVIMGPDVEAPEDSEFRLAPHLIAFGIPKETVINQAEVSAGLVALDTWGQNFSI